MKRTLLSMILVLTTLVSFSQEPFVMGNTYPQGWVVYYPSYGTFWIARPVIPFVAKKTPNNDTLVNWKSFSYPVTKPVLTVDSLEKRLKLAETNMVLLQNTITTLQQALTTTQAKLSSSPTAQYVDAQFKAVNDKVTTLLIPGNKTIKLANWSIPLFSISKDSSTYTFKTLIQNKDFKYISTDSTIEITKAN